MIKESIKKSVIGKAWNWFQSQRVRLVEKFIIPGYQEKREILLSYRNRYRTNTFVETGTFFGDTIDFFKDKFEKLYSIELSEELAGKAVNRFKDHHHIQIVQGDSGIELDRLLKKFSAPALFWLDGHYSSEFYIGDEYIKTARSEKDTPIEKELMSLMKSPLKHVILIDDARLFTGRGDYPSKKKLRQLVGSFRRPFRFDVKRDIIRIVLQ